LAECSREWCGGTGRRKLVSGIAGHRWPRRAGRLHLFGHHGPPPLFELFRFPDAAGCDDPLGGFASPHRPDCNPATVPVAAPAARPLLVDSKLTCWSLFWPSSYLIVSARPENSRDCKSAWPSAFMEGSV